MLAAPALALAVFAALPPITSLPEALAQLSAQGGGAQLEALQNLERACRGKYRRDLKDRPELLARAEALAGGGDAAVRRAALDLGRCFGAPALLRLVEPALADADPAVVAYAAEVAARAEDALFVAPLLARLAAAAERCLVPGLAPGAVEVCVWLTYAPGALLAAATAEQKRHAGDAAVRMLASPYPKVREVAVETLSATGMKVYAAALAKLVARETTPGALEQPNGAALVGRFRQRQRSLEAGK